MSSPVLGPVTTEVHLAVINIDGVIKQLSCNEGVDGCPGRDIRSVKTFMFLPSSVH